MLDLPNATDESVLDLGFTVMRDYADGILMDPEEIEKERGVILAEKDARDSVSMRLWQKLYSFLLPNHRVSKRFPIGTEEVISTAPRQRFLDFYGEHYSPEQITFIAVGDTDVATMKERIIEAYESMESRRSPEDFEEIDLGTVSTGQGFRTAVYTDEELVHDRLFINVIRPYEMKDDTEDNRISALPLNIANRILSQRLKNVAKKEGSPFLSGSAYRDGWFLKSGVEWGEISLTPVSGGDSEWKACIPIIEQELRRAIEYGFAPFELEEQKANLLRSYQKAVDTVSTQKSQALAKQLVDSINSKSVVSSPEENLRIIEKGVETITVEQLHDVFKSFWDTPDHTLVLYAKEAEANAVEEMNQIYENSKLSPVSPPDMTFDATFHYTSFGSAGTIVSDTYIEDLDVRQLKLSNKVRVNLKATDFEANTVRIVARFGSGSLSQPSAKSGIQWLAPIIINEGGLGKHSKTDLTRILAGNNVQQASFSISEDSFNIMGKTTPEDLELQLQLMAAYLSDPGYRPEAEQYWQNIIPSYPDWFAHTFDGVNYNVTTSFLRGHDGRFRVPSLEEMASLTADDVREWLHPEMSASYLEVSVVGDFDADLIIPFLLNSFGALPEREDSPAIMPTELTSLPYPPTPSEHVFAYESKMPHAAAMLVFRVPPLREDIRLTRRLNILSSVLRDRMRKEIREEQAASYGPVVYVTASESYDFGALIAYSKGSPENTAGMTTVIEALATNLTGAMTEDELLRAKEPTMTSLKDTLRSNTYWLNNVVSESQSKPWILDWSRERDDDYSSITVDEIIELARKFFTKENTMKIDIIPITNKE